jgi:hypothetical protein
VSQEVVKAALQDPLVALSACALLLYRFYGGYHACKYVSRVARDKNDMGNSVVAAVGTVAPMALSATFRRNIPYAALLVAIDFYNELHER